MVAATCPTVRTDAHERCVRKSFQHLSCDNLADLAMRL
jgi:hypothetical protein